MLLTAALPSPEGCSATSTPRVALHHGPHSLSKCSCSAPNTAPLTMNYSHMHNKISTNELCCVVTHKNAQNTTAHTRCTLAGAFVLSGLPWCSDYCAVFLTNPNPNPSPYLCNAHVLHLLHSHLPSERTTALEVAVLWRHQSPVGELPTAVGHVQGRWAHVHIALAGVACIDVGDEVIKLLHGIGVAFPVTPDDRLAGCGHCAVCCWKHDTV